MATLKDIAKMSNLSITAVSYALKGSNKVSRETIRKVGKIAEKLNYHPSGLAKSLKNNKTWNIGIYLHGFLWPMYGPLLQAMCDIASGRGYEIFVASTKLSKRLLVERYTDGAILLNSFVSNKFIENLQCPEFPIVLMDRKLTLPNVSAVTMDNALGGYCAAMELLLANYKHLGIISGNKDSEENLERLEGIKKALIERGLDPQDIPISVGHFTEEEGREAAIRLLTDYPEVDALVCNNDEMALGAMTAIKQLGRDVGRDIGVIGYDDIPLAAHSNPSLSTIRVDYAQWGYMAVSTLIDMIENKTEGRAVTIPVSVVRRQSVDKIELGF